jgi:indoleamine 2,3-dioxygenase
MLDEVGRDLPSLLEDRGFRSYARELVIPLWPTKTQVQSDELAVLRLYYLRVGFLASAYVNQIGQEPTSILPVTIAVPLCQVCTMLQRPPILSYDGYALYNWKRCRPTEPIALGNLETLQNFVHLYDEHWFILVHVEIEAIAAELLGAIDSTRKALAGNEPASIEDNLERIEQAIRRQVRVLKRIPEKMDPDL